MRSGTAFVVGLAGTCAVFAAFAPLVAAAEEWRVHNGSACVSTEYIPGGGLGPPLSYYNDTGYGQVANQTNSNLVATCPIESDSFLKVTSSYYTTLWVRGYSNVGGPGVDYNFFRACRTYAGGGGGACGNTTKTSAVGVYNLSVDTSVWSATNGATTSDPMYLVVGLDNAINGSFNTFWQYKVTTNN